MPGKVALSDARFTIVGAKADLSIVLEPASKGTSLVGAAKFEGADIGQLTRMLGMGRPPLEGRLSAGATLTMSGLSLPEALKASRGAAVLSMNGGVVSRQLMQWPPPICGCCSAAERVTLASLACWPSRICKVSQGRSR